MLSVKKSAFTVLQQRHSDFKQIDICHAMDLVAGLASDGDVLQIFRTHSWDKVTHKPCFDILGISATALRFSPQGKLIALGGEDGRVALYDIEGSASILAHAPPNTSVNVPIVHLSFANADILCRQMTTGDNMWSEAWFHGGLDAVARAGVCEYSEVEDEIDTSKIPLEVVHELLHGYILLALDTENRLSVYAFGIYPLFTVSLNELSNGSGRWRLSDLSVSDRDIAISRFASDATIDKQMDVQTILLEPPLFRCYKWDERVSLLLISIQCDIDRLIDFCSQCARKWKDATKLLPIKLGLLHTALEGYQLPYNPVSFFYTVAMCGAWHPVAQTTFSQHWNEQGISRLRVGIDMAAQSVSKIIKMKMMPLATNLQLRCRELEAMMAVAPVEGIDLSHEQVLHVEELRRCCELVLYKLDDTASEADGAKTGLLLFLQFIKEYHTACAADPAAAGSVSPNVETMKTYMNLFDPRLVRAPSTAAATSKLFSTGSVKGETSSTDLSSGVKCPPVLVMRTAEAEAVCGTHLYAYLQEEGHVPEPNGRKTDRRRFSNLANPENADIDSIVKEEKEISDFYQDLSILLLQLEAIDGPRLEMLDDRAYRSRSLAAQLKLTKDLFSKIVGLSARVIKWDSSVISAAAFRVSDDATIMAVDVCSLKNVTLSLDASAEYLTEPYAYNATKNELFLSSCSTLAVACGRKSTKEIQILVKTYSSCGIGKSQWLVAKINFPDWLGVISVVNLYHRLEAPMTTAAAAINNNVKNFGLIVTSSGSMSDSAQLLKIDLTRVPFHVVEVDDSLGRLPSMEEIDKIYSTRRKGLLFQTKQSQDSDDEDEESVVKYRELPPGKVVSLHVSGQRGLACVMTSTVGSRLGSKRLVVVDMEEDEELDDDDEDDNDGAMDTSI